MRQLQVKVGRASRALTKSRAAVSRVLAFLWRSRPILAGIFGIFVVLIILLALWKVPEWQIAPWRDLIEPRDLLERENAARATLAQIIGGLVLLYGVYLTWRRIAATEKSVAIAQEGQITERFTRAIEQLGSEKLEVRLGGIYALERIARDSERDHWTIMEVLTAYVRERAPWREDALDPPPSLPTDIQAILTVLGRRSRTHGKGEEERLDLRGTGLRRANLARAHLEGADLRVAHLEWAILRVAHLESAILMDAHLEGADLRDAHLEGAILMDAHLEGADLRDAHLEWAILMDAHLEGADLRGTRLEGADLRNAHLEGADLRDAHLEGADLMDAHLEGANLSAANPKEAELPGTAVPPDSA